MCFEALDSIIEGVLESDFRLALAGVSGIANVFSEEVRLEAGSDLLRKPSEGSLVYDEETHIVSFFVTFSSFSSYHLRVTGSDRSD